MTEIPNIGEVILYESADFKGFKEPFEVGNYPLKFVQVIRSIKIGPNTGLILLDSKEFPLTQKKIENAIKVYMNNSNTVMNVNNIMTNHPIVAIKVEPMPDDKYGTPSCPGKLNLYDKPQFTGEQQVYTMGTHEVSKPSSYGLSFKIAPSTVVTFSSSFEDQIKEVFMVYANGTDRIWFIPYNRFDNSIDEIKIEEYDIQEVCEGFEGSQKYYNYITLSIICLIIIIILFFVYKNRNLIYK
jgi:hypothetical protein